jgi:hypothetical protein
VNVLRHDDVAEHDKLVTLADVLKNLLEEIAALGRCQQFATPIATGGDEMKVSATIMAFRRLGMREV